MSKILVTGGAGFIASHIVDHYLELGHEVIAVDNLATGSRHNLNPSARFVEMDVRSAEFAALIEREKPEVINHHAAQTMVRPSTENPIYDTQVNVQGILNLLQAAVKAGTRKIIFASSGGTVYGTPKPEHLPVKEDHPFAPESPYGISKAASEFYLRYYAANFPIVFTALRYANVFGSRDEISSEHVITVFAKRLLAGQQPVIHWDGEQAKDYIYVTDVARANGLALNAGDNRSYNIGEGKPTSVNQIYRAVSDAIGARVQPAYGPKRMGDVRLVYFDCARAAQELGWRPQVSFEEGIAKTIEWYKTV